MPELAESLAELTTHKDRDELELALARTLNELLLPLPLSVSLCREVGETLDPRWLTAVRFAPGEPAPVLQMPWIESDHLPRLSAHPQRQRALDEHKVLRDCGPPHLTLFPLASRFDGRCMLEIASAEALPAESERLVSGVLRLYRNFQDLLDYGERDALTELLNRKTFDGAFLKATLRQKNAQRGAESDRRSASRQGSYWLGMIDIDHFKRVNDNHGHLIGDEVLLLMARLMRACFRSYDQLYRFGGEEFVVMMQCASEADAMHALERLRSATERHAFPQVGCITISIGLCEIRVADSPSGAFERADKALYHAKQHGRNQVCSHAALVAQGALQPQAEVVGEVELF